MTPDPREIESFRLARDQVLARIAEACARVGRSPDEVTLLPVSKTVPAERLAAAVAAGFADLGENRVQEIADKVPELPDVRWHLIGPLQSNKARRAVELCASVQSVDSVALGLRLDRLVREVRGLAADGAVDPARRLPIYLQVNVDADPAKFGFEIGGLESALDGLAACDALEIVGLMTVGRLVGSAEEARSTFAGLRELSERLRRDRPRLGPGLSMGMSEDYAVAIEEGATVVRVGRAIFGERPLGTATGG
jgi:pyridoxal phosphate enzyme (YggS family)